MSQRGHQALDDLDDDIRDHIIRETEENIARGMEPDAAAAAARRAFGNVTLTKEAAREIWIPIWWDQLMQDASYAIRMFRRAPGFTAVGVLTLALGIGANTAIFSVVHAVLLKPLAYSNDSDRLVRLMMTMPPAVSPTGRPLRAMVTLSAAEVLDLQSRTQSLSRVGIAGPELMSLRGYEGAARLPGARLSSTVFAMLAARPLLGRLPGASDEAPGAEPVVVLSYAAWRDYFGGDPSVLQRTVTLDSVLGRHREWRSRVIGVMPHDFSFPSSQTQFWMPFAVAVAGEARASRGPMLGILGEGLTMQAAAAELGPIVRDLRKDKPGITYDLVRERDELVAPVRSALLVLTVAVGFVLLIACVNVANLQLARMTARQREIAVRVAIGAGRARLIRQTLTESVVLALLGGVAGIGVAVGGVKLLHVLTATLARVDLVNGPLAFPRFDEIGIDGSVLLFTLATSVTTGVMFGLAPSLRHAGSDPMETLRSAGAGATGRRFRAAQVTTVRGALVVAQVALAMILLVGGGLLMHSFMKLAAIAPGYDAANVLTFQVSLPVDRFSDARLTAFADDLVTRLQAVPSVRATAYANQLPTVQLRDTAGGLWKTPDPDRAPSPIGADARLISQNYLQTMGIRVINGRSFGEQDRAGQPGVLLVNLALARRDFPGENPIGQRVYVGRDTVPWQIVGVVDNVREFGLDREPEPQFFIDFRQWSRPGLLFPTGAYYTIRTEADPASMIADVRSIVHQLDSQAALFHVAPMEQLVATTLAPRRTYAVLLGLFATLGLVLAVIGIYGVMAYAVTQRTREIGVRMALGARPANVLRLVLRQSLTLTAIGVGVGLAGAAAVSRYLEGMLFGLTPLDPATFVAVGLAFISIAALASYVPARRAANVDPMIALRCE
jgi:putative ABC transport system permease protein